MRSKTLGASDVIVKNHRPILAVPTTARSIVHNGKDRFLSVRSLGGDTDYFRKVGISSATTSMKCAFIVRNSVNWSPI